MWAAEFEKLGSECTSDARDWVQLSPADKDKHHEPACQYATQLPIIIAVIPALCARDRWENITRPQGAYARNRQRNFLTQPIAMF